MGGKEAGLTGMISGLPDVPGRSEIGDGNGESPLYWLLAMIDSSKVGCGQAVVVCGKHRQGPPSQGLRSARSIWGGLFPNCKFRPRSATRHGYLCLRIAFARSTPPAPAAATATLQA